MKTQIIKINSGLIEVDKIKSIAEVLKNKGIIVYPTDTFYGLGVDCFSREAIKRIYQLKKRKEAKPLSVMISNAEQVREIAVEIPPSYWILSRKFWPGPLTLIFKASSQLPQELLGPSQTIGVRLPALFWLRELIKETKFPITATSANISGEKEISHVEKVIEVFLGKVDLVVDGGKTPGTKPSTILDLTPKTPKILREGAIAKAKLTRYLKI